MKTQRTIIQHRDQSSSVRADDIAPEEPMELRVEGRSISIFMRTPGHDLDLATGFLRTESVIEDRDDIHAMRHVIEPLDGSQNTVDTVLSTGLSRQLQLLSERKLFASSACGVCGTATMDNLFTTLSPFESPQIVRPELIQTLPPLLLQEQHLFSQTGGIHAAALFSLQGSFVVLREDIGRHNAVDKVIGHCIRQDIDLSDLLLMVSGRVGYEIVQKALVARIPVIAAIGAPSTLAVDLCRRANLTLFGFVSRTRSNQYTNVQTPSAQE